MQLGGFMNIKKEELILIKGGGSSLISGTILNGVVRGVQFLYQLGQALGTSISRMKNKRYC